MSEHDRSTVGQDDSHQHKSHATAVGVLSWSKRVASGCCHDVVLSCCKFVDIAIIATVIVAVWGLFSLPVIFIAIEESSFVQSNDSTCSPQNYTGNVCYDALSSRQQCIPGMRNSTDILIKSELLLGLSQESLENVLVGGFSSRPHNRVECDEIIRTLICLHVFTPCGEDGQLHAPSLEECTAVRNIQCAQEWADIEALAPKQALPLPTCETLPPPSALSLCPGDLSGSGFFQLSPSMTQMNTTSEISDLPSSPPNFTCSADFYFDDYCKPICGQWKPFSDSVDVMVKVLIITGAVMGIIMAVMIIALSVLKYKHMLKFPSILILYQLADTCIFLLVSLIGYMDTESLLCSSQDYTQRLVSSTAYCTSYGIGLFFIEHGVIIWASHVAIVLWQISFPLQAKYAQTSKHYRLLHIIIVALATMFAAGYTAVSLGTGDHRPFYYPIACVPASTAAIFYHNILISLCEATGVSFLALLLWVLAKRRLKCVLKTSRNSNEQIHCGNSLIPTTTLVKVLLIFFGYTVVIIVGLYATISALHVQSEYRKALTEYFSCESNITSHDKVCRRSFESLYSPLPSTLSIFLVGTLYPLATLMYVVNLEKLCRCVKQCFHGRNGLHGTSPLQMSVSIKYYP